MSANTQTVEASSQSPASVNDLHNQEVRRLVMQGGIYVTGAVEQWSMEGKSGSAGFIQLLIPQNDDTKALNLLRIKVPETRFGTIDVLNKSKSFQMVQIQIEVSESYGKVRYIMTKDQPTMKAN